jgi:hypothetical protein
MAAFKGGVSLCGRRLKGPQLMRKTLGRLHGHHLCTR